METTVTQRLGDDLTVPYSRYTEGARVGACAYLEDVRLHSMQGELFDFGDFTSLRPDLQVDVHVTPPAESGAFVVVADYALRLTRADSGGDSDEDPEDFEAESEGVAIVKVGVAGLYSSHQLPDDLKDNELEAYAISAGVLALHPFAREFIATTLQRLGLPPLHLPPVRVTSDNPMN